MNRKQLYNEIVSLGLQEEIKMRYKKNYTQCTNEQLEKVVNGAAKPLKEATKKPKCKDIAKAFIDLVNVLKRKKILLDSEVDLILNK